MLQGSIPAAESFTREGKIQKLTDWLTYEDLVSWGPLERLKALLPPYQTSVAILFVGYILRQVPSNMLITGIQPSLFMAPFMAL
ncbi:hypothetical protein CEP53_002376 [Fusarium sp. AF-6]|nr:hypothetical protein CEP53_002376 [Fusarium sp. AF-6]